MKRLHPDTIEAVKNRADIREIVPEFCTMTAKDQGLLPDGRAVLIFPSERTYAIIPGHLAGWSDTFYKSYHEEFGNSIHFVMTVGGKNFTDAVIYLAQRYQIPVETYEDARLAA